MFANETKRIAFISFEVTDDPQQINYIKTQFVTILRLQMKFWLHDRSKP